MSDTDRSLEQLLSTASPRPVPSPDDAAAAREVVHAEWLAVSGKHRSQRTMMRYAIAASVLIAVFPVFNSLRVPPAEVVRVASIEKSVGSVYVLGERSQMTLTKSLAAIHSGQTIVTGDNAGLALAWDNGGSVRLDRKTEVTFKDNNTVYLKYGQVYFDSKPSGLGVAMSAGEIDVFTIETDFGAVTHVGTQFMTRIDTNELIVSVREGTVDIANERHAYQAEKGEQVVFRERQQPVIVDFPEYGSTWDWIGRLTPPVSVEGRSAYDFLQWVGRELGRTVNFSSGAVEQETRHALLLGDVVSEPAEALKQRMHTVDIDWRFEKGAIYVGNDD